MSDEFVRDLGAGIDTMDASIFVRFLTKDATFRFGNGDPVQGRDAIRNYVDAFFQAIKSIRHDPLRVHEAGDFLIAEMNCTYVDRWNRTLKVPVCNVMMMRGQQISEYFIYIDNHELFVPPLSTQREAVSA